MVFMFLAVYGLFGVIFGLVAIYNFRNGKTGFAAAALAGSAYAAFRAAMVIHRARQG